MHYTGTIWRPPYEAYSLLIEATAGCTHHKCKFCTLYNDLPFNFKMTPIKDFESDLQELQMLSNDPIARLSYKLRDIPNPNFSRRFFLTGANPFVLKSERLLEIASLIEKYFPSGGQYRSIGSFARITDIELKTDRQLEELAGAGYNGITIGVETGDNEALQFMNKGYSSEDIVTQCKRLDNVGISYNFFYLTGISGAGKGEKGANLTAEVFNTLHPKRVCANMLTVYPDSELYKEIQNNNWREESEIEKYRELRALANSLTIPVWFGALGASNPIPIQGTLPQNKKEILSVLDMIIKEVKEEELQKYRRNLRHL